MKHNILLFYILFFNMGDIIATPNFSSSKLDHVWVLRYSNYNNFFAHFLDIESKKAFVVDKGAFMDKTHEIDITIWENKYVQIGTITYDFVFSKDKNTLYVEALGRKHVYKKYLSTNEMSEIKIETFDKYWINESSNLIFNFSKKTPSKAILYKRQMNIISNDGELSGNWSLYNYKNLYLLRYQIEGNKNYFIVLTFINEELLTGYLWNYENQCEENYSLKYFN